MSTAVLSRIRCNWTILRWQFGTPVTCQFCFGSFATDSTLLYSLTLLTLVVGFQPKDRLCSESYIFTGAKMGVRALSFLHHACATLSGEMTWVIILPHNVPASSTERTWEGVIRHVLLVFSWSKGKERGMYSLSWVTTTSLRCAWGSGGGGMYQCPLLWAQS